MSTAVSLEQGFKLRKQFEDSIKLMSIKVSSSITQYDGYGLVVSIVLLWLVRIYMCSRLICLQLIGISLYHDDNKR